MEQFHGTTIVSVRRGGAVAIGGDGQVTLGSRRGQGVRPQGAPPLPATASSPGSPARRPTRSRCSSASRPSSRSTRATCCARRWNSRRTGAPTACCAAWRRCSPWPTARPRSCITGNGDVLEPERGIVAIGSGGSYAQAAAIALLEQHRPRRPPTSSSARSRSPATSASTPTRTTWSRRSERSRGARPRRARPPTPSPRPAASMMTPQEIVHELDKHIVGQHAAKKAVAIALRNRWRRSQVAEPLRGEITPKNILMIGPTGVGKTEIARRLARLANAPFVKVEATKFTEVGYVGPRRRHDHPRPRRGGRQVDARAGDAEGQAARAEDGAEERILDALLPRLGVAADGGPEAGGDAPARFRKMLREGEARRQGDRDRRRAGDGAMEIMAPAGHGGAHPADPGMFATWGRRAAPQPQARDPRGAAPLRRRGGRASW